MCDDIHTAKRGRKSGESMKLVAFNLPERLICVIEANADRKTAGNKSALIRNILQGKMILE